MKRLAIAFACAAATLWLAPAHAEIWGYVDGSGVAHFAAEKMDERFQLFFRGGQNFDTDAGVQSPVPALAQPRSAAASKLLSFFDLSPAYKKVQQHLRDASRENGLEYELLQAVIATESGFDAGAVSPKGAIGLMQVLPATAQRYGLRGDSKAPLERKLTDPRTNVHTGARYLRDLLHMFPGRLELALAAYNAGEGAVQRAGNRIPNYRETQNYVKTVVQIYGMLKPAGVAAGTGTGKAPRRVQMELPGPTAATARRNMPAGFSQAPALPLAAQASAAD